MVGTNSNHHLYVRLAVIWCKYKCLFVCEAYGDWCKHKSSFACKACCDWSKLKLSFACEVCDLCTFLSSGFRNRLLSSLGSVLREQKVCPNMVAPRATLS